jgi:hypothetical protein
LLTQVLEAVEVVLVPPVLTLELVELLEPILKQLLIIPLVHISTQLVQQVQLEAPELQAQLEALVQLAILWWKNTTQSKLLSPLLDSLLFKNSLLVQVLTQLPLAPSTSE